MTTTKQTLESRLRRLRLGQMALALEAASAESIRAKHSYLEFLEGLVDGELAARENKGLMKRVREARFPVPKTLEEFDFDFQPRLDVKLVKTLAGCAFVERRENVALIGQPGTGKSHLALGLGMKALERGFRVRFTTLQDLAADLKASRADDTTEEVIQRFLEPELVILDELGFSRLDPIVADAVFRIVASRYERGSVIVTSNKSFESWADVFPDAVIASAVLDRLVHHAHLIPIVGESYRMKELKARKKPGDKEPRAA